MKPNCQRGALSGRLLYTLKKTALALLLTAAAGPLTAQTIPNPGFETDTFTVWPGYIADNAPITGWTAIPETNVGLNPSPDSPFANNGTVPEGRNVAFLQGQGNEGPTELSTQISGLTPNTRYRLSFRTNARNGPEPVLSVTVGDNELMRTSITPVGGAAAWRYVHLYFEAAAAEETLVLRNEVTTDNTVLVDDFRITAEPEGQGWSFDEWNDDETAGVDTTFRYTHAYSFYNNAAPADTEIDGLLFTGVGGVNPAVLNRFTVSNLGAGTLDENPEITGSSADMAEQFIYNGNPGTLDLVALKPDTAYTLTVYSVAWEDSGIRWVTLRSGDSGLSVDQDTFGNNRGIRITYSYTSDAAGRVSVNMQGLSAGSFHLYGFSNRETNPPVDEAPQVVVNPLGGRVLTGDTLTIFAEAPGQPAPTYQWQRNGADISDGAQYTGATTASLEITPAGAAEAGVYTLKATNSLGTGTSGGAFVEVVEPRAGPLFSTGVDETGLALSGGEEDPHYTLIQDPEGETDFPAVVQTNIPLPAWLENTDNTQWVGPMPDTSSGAIGHYVYRTSVDAGANPDTFTFSGYWAVDNVGLEIRVNDQPVTGLTMSRGFGAYTWFSISKGNAPSLKAGLNTVDFVVDNEGPAIGYTGLRILSAGVPAGIAPVIMDQPRGGTIISGQPATVSVRVYGSDPLSYQWTFNGADIPGAIHSAYTISAFTPAQAGTYAVKVTSPLGPVTLTSTGAELVITDVPPSIVTQPAGTLRGAGESYTLSVTPAGSAPYSYEWSKDGAVIPTATESTLTFNALAKTDSGSYTVKVTNAFGNITSAAAVVQVMDRVPGTFNTGIADDGTPLPDDEEDPHYTLIINPGGENGIQAVVHRSTIFPISTSNWLANSDTSKWISPLADSATASGENEDGGEGPGIYVYRTTFNLTGFDPASVVITGAWSSDNGGPAIRVNEADTGLTGPGTFNTLTPFTINDENADFLPGVNTLDFLVLNSGEANGPTALRVEMRVLGAAAPQTGTLPAVNIRLSAAGKPVISFTGIAGSTYRIERSTTLAAGSWTDASGALAAPANGLVEFEDDTAPAGRAFYRVIVPTPAG